MDTIYMILAVVAAIGFWLCLKVKFYRLEEVLRKEHEAHLEDLGWLRGEQEQNRYYRARMKALIEKMDGVKAENDKLKAALGERFAADVLKWEGHKDIVTGEKHD